MPFKKIAKSDIIGSLNYKGEVSSKTASFAKYESIYLDGGKSINIEAILDTVSDVYNVSRNPNDYLLVPARAVSANYHNENLDFFSDDELVRFDPKLGRKVYSTFTLCPSFVNHNAENYKLSRGVIIDSHLNDVNPASDIIKEAVYNSIGIEPDNDVFTECLVALDSTKDPALVNGFKTGSIDAFSMGADVESTTCNICGKTAATTFQLCPHIRSKFSRKKYQMPDGSLRVAFEVCNGTIFRELSTVDDPADKNALVQEGLLDFQMSKMSSNEIADISRYVINNIGRMPNSVAKALCQALDRRG